MEFGGTTELGMIQRRTGYIANAPTSRNRTVTFLEVIAPLRWHNNPRSEIDQYVPIGGLTWVYSYNPLESLLIEDNRYRVNYDPACFRVIKHENYGDVDMRIKDPAEYVAEHASYESSAPKADSSCPTIREESPIVNISVEKTNKITDDIIVESTINITI